MRWAAGGAADYLLQKLGKGKDSDGELWALLKKEHELGMELRRPFEQVWLLNLAFISSRQHVFFNATAHQLQYLMRKPGQRRVVDNQLLAKWRRQVADLIKNDPEMSVVPNTTDEEDILAAKAGSKVLLHWWKNGRMKKTVRLLAVWIYSTGNAFLEDMWDQGIGPEQLEPQTGKLVYEGDVSCNLWSPFEIVVPASGMFVGDLNTLPWIETYSWKTIEWIKGFIGGKQVKDLKGEIRPANDVTMTTLFGGTSTKPSELTRGAMFHEFKVKPCEAFPKGLHAYAAEGKILERNDFPFVEYPIEHFKDIENAGVFWGAATVEHAIGLQKRWNRTMDSIDTFNEVMGKGKWLTPRQANMSVEPNDEHGEIVTYSPVMGLKPEHLSLKGLPSSYETVLGSTRASLENLFSQHEVTRGTNKSDIRSGDMLEILREQDAHGNIPSHMVFEESLERLGARILQRIQKGYKTERIIKIPGKDAQWEVFAFKGADLRGNTDVSVKRQSSLPDSRRAREAQIFERFQQGLYGNPQDPEVRRQVMNMLQDAVVENTYEETRLDETVSRNENKLMLQEKAPDILVNSYDNHGVHAREHNMFRKGHDYQATKFKDPKMFALLEARYEKHIMQHVKFLEEQRQRMLEEQAMLKGKEGGGA